MTPEEIQDMVARTATPGLFAQYVSGGKWELRPHLAHLDRILTDAITHRGPDRLIVNMPPRHGKSWLTSKYLPAWYLGTFPDRRVMLSGYGKVFGKVWGAAALHELSTNAELFELLVPPRQNPMHWEIPGRLGGMWTSSVGGAMTGLGADLLIIDDPIKHAKEADSETYRESIWNWWQTTARTRLEPGGVIIIVLTRWHEDDLAGRILSGRFVSQEDAAFADKWHVVSFPALAEKRDELGREVGDALWPERYSVPMLRQIKGGTTPRVWQAMYQQNPQPLEGGMLSRGDWRIVYTLPDLEYVHNWVRYWDKAGTEDAGDFSAGVLMCEFRGAFYVVDVQRGQWGAAKREAIILATAHRDRAAYGQSVETWVEQEPGSSGKESAENTAKNLAGFIVFIDKVTGEKVVRAGPLATQQQMNNVFLLHAPWNEAFIVEAAGFPHGTHDDQVDAAGGAFNKLAAKTFPDLASSAITAVRPDIPKPDEVEPGARYGVSGRSAGGTRIFSGARAAREARIFRKQ
jgi:predicted phage terminase large subunit-like protein